MIATLPKNRVWKWLQHLHRILRKVYQDPASAEHKIHSNYFCYLFLYTWRYSISHFCGKTSILSLVLCIWVLSDKAFGCTQTNVDLHQFLEFFQFSGDGIWSSHIWFFSEKVIVVLKCSWCDISGHSNIACLHHHYQSMIPYAMQEITCWQLIQYPADIKDRGQTPCVHHHHQMELPGCKLNKQPVTMSFVVETNQQPSLLCCFFICLLLTDSIDKETKSYTQSAIHFLHLSENIQMLYLRSPHCLV